MKEFAAQPYERSPMEKITDKQLYDELNGYRAEKLLKKLQEQGLITGEEFKRILVEIRKIFVPIFAELM